MWALLTGARICPSDVLAGVTGAGAAERGLAARPPLGPGQRRHGRLLNTSRQLLRLMDADAIIYDSGVSDTSTLVRVCAWNL